MDILQLVFISSSFLERGWKFNYFLEIRFEKIKRRVGLSGGRELKLIQGKDGDNCMQNQLDVYLATSQDQYFMQIIQIAHCNSDLESNNPA